MKLSKSLFFVTLLAMLLYSCKDNTPTEPGDNGTGLVKTTINGSISLNFKSTATFVVINLKVEPRDYPFMLIIGYMGSKYEISIEIFRNLDTCSVTLKSMAEAVNDSNGYAEFIAMVGKTDSRMFMSMSGAASVTSVSGNRLKGTFQFTGVDYSDESQITVSQGIFDVPITN
ncbi:hypothetical protein EH223_08630 [candidate division KSB1 bacterium]|nr:MAG: hypothetical protein EH223_08630 [candidate division KSB1 bacterium]